MTTVAKLSPEALIAARISFHCICAFGAGAIVGAYILFLIETQSMKHWDMPRARMGEESKPQKEPCGCH